MCIMVGFSSLCGSACVPPSCGEKCPLKPAGGRGQVGWVCVLPPSAPSPISSFGGGGGGFYLLCGCHLVGIGFPLGDIQSLSNDQSLSNSQFTEWMSFDRDWWISNPYQITVPIKFHSRRSTGMASALPETTVRYMAPAPSACPLPVPGEPTCTKLLGGFAVALWL